MRNIWWFLSWRAVDGTFEPYHSYTAACIWIRILLPMNLRGDTPGDKEGWRPLPPTRLYNGMGMQIIRSRPFPLVWKPPGNPNILAGRVDDLTARAMAFSKEHRPFAQPLASPGRRRWASSPRWKISSKPSTTSIAPFTSRRSRSEVDPDDLKLAKV